MKKLQIKVFTALFAVMSLFLVACNGTQKGTFEIGKGTFLLNGEPFVVKAAEGSLSTNSSAVLGTAYPFMQGFRNEYIMPLCVLEPS